MSVHTIPLSNGGRLEWERLKGGQETQICVKSHKVPQAILRRIAEMKPRTVQRSLPGVRKVIFSKRGNRLFLCMLPENEGFDSTETTMESLTAIIKNYLVFKPHRPCKNKPMKMLFRRTARQHAERRRQQQLDAVLSAL